MIDVSVKNKLIFFLLRMPPKLHTRESIFEMNREALYCQVLDENKINIIRISNDFHDITASVWFKGEDIMLCFVSVNAFNLL